jgi:peptide/nickel transport system permease protein
MPFVLRRLGFFVVTLWAAVSLNFVIPRLMPGNPIQALEAAHPHLDPQSIHALTTLLGGGYQGSLVSQYFTYWERVLTFNFGISITTSFGTSVTTMVLHALPWTIGLVGVTTVLAFLLGTLIGLVSAWRRGS